MELINMKNNVLKFLCKSSFVLNILITVMSFFRYDMIGDGFHKLLEYDSAGYVLPIYFVWPIFLITLLSTTIPLLFIYKHNVTAYRIFILGMLFTVLVTLISGVRVTLPIENFIGSLIYLLSGAILVIGLLDERLSKAYDVIGLSNIDNTHK